MKGDKMENMFKIVNIMTWEEYVEKIAENIEKSIENMRKRRGNELAI